MKEVDDGLLEAGKDYSFELGSFNMEDNEYLASPDIYITVPHVNGTELKVHFFLDDRGDCRSGIIEWAEDVETDFIWLSERPDLEGEKGIDYGEIDEIIELLRKYADDYLTRYLLQK
jgi:hypothetical protein